MSHQRISLEALYGPGPYGTIDIKPAPPVFIVLHSRRGLTMWALTEEGWRLCTISGEPLMWSSEPMPEGEARYELMRRRLRYAYNPET